jgi:hypothetical protein
MEEATSSNSSDDDVVVMEEVTVEQAPDLLDMQQRFNTNYQSIDTTTNNQKTDSVIRFIVTRRDRLLSLSNTGEHTRLYSALLKTKGNDNNTASHV